MSTTIVFNASPVKADTKNTGFFTTPPKQPSCSLPYASASASASASSSSHMMQLVGGKICDGTPYGGSVIRPL